MRTSPGGEGMKGGRPVRVLIFRICQQTHHRGIRLMDSLFAQTVRYVTAGDIGMPPRREVGGGPYRGTPRTGGRGEGEDVVELRRRMLRRVWRGIGRFTRLVGEHGGISFR